MTEYVDKSALVAEIEKLNRKFTNTDDEDYAEGFRYCLMLISSFLNTLEVKEVDLKKEMSEYFVEHSDEFFSDKYKLFAKHFFELGIKAAQKGE